MQSKMKELWNHSKKLKGVESMSETVEYLLEIKQAKKASKQDFILKQHPKGLGEGSDISSYEERSEANDTKKVDAEKVKADKAEEEKAGKEQHIDATLISSSLTLSSAEYSNQFFNDNPDVSINEVLKDPAEIEKRHHEDQDPPANANKETKKRKKKDFDASSSKKSKDKEDSSKGSSISDTNKMMARMDAMDMKMDTQYKEFQSRSKCNHCGGNYSTADCNDDDTLMSNKEEETFMQTFHRIHFHNDYRDTNGYN
ncbi:hypothetical protein Tco_0309407 [Tanacetum coccineum]